MGVATTTIARLFLLPLLIAVHGNRALRCDEGPLERREEQANIVLTGTVGKLYGDPAGGKYMCEVEVKRVFKGRGDVLNLLEGPQHNTIMIGGFGNPALCHSDVRERDTRIFLLAKDGKSLSLNSSLVRMTLNNLKHSEAAVEDVPYVSRPPPTPEPCEITYCAYGATCHANDTDGAYCDCEETCTSVFAPVCGSDGVTYINACHLRRASCNKQESIVIRQERQCDERDPCENTRCPYGAECVRSIDGTTAACECPKACYSYGDNVGGAEVCGSDGRNYPNTCELNKAACENMRNISVVYEGKCDPCSEVTCSRGFACQLDSHRRPICRCSQLCSMEIDPVCASDGKSYTNECVMKADACLNRKQLRMLYRGYCDTGMNPCDNIRCGPGQECSVGTDNKASCVCPSPCEKLLRPVCGSDGVSYGSICELRRQACLNGKVVSVVASTNCDDEGPCKGYRCSYNARCIVKDGRPLCECPSCSADRHRHPICGSDGIMYTNECQLKQEACLKKMDITVANEGLCDGCEGIQCDYYGICESDGKSGKCVCPDTCVKVNAPVCGSNGHSYESECELRIDACRKKEFIVVSSQGRCESCLGVKCKFGAMCESGKCICRSYCPELYDPVCGTDMVTYDSECHLSMLACQRGLDGLEVLQAGECDDIEGSGSGDFGSGEIDGYCDEDVCRYGGRCVDDDDGGSSCQCSFGCMAVREPTCGSDGKLYGNECELRQTACRQQQEITPRPSDRCEELEELPCDGDPPLVNGTSGEELYCGEGNFSCPAGSYCHISFDGGFAKCCREEPTIRTCEETEYGCCEDGRTAAPAAGGKGCPAYCNCNKLGAYQTTCDPLTRQCSCKPGVGGQMCDRCEPGFWGLPRIRQGNTGCIPCGCSKFGSVRDDCEQMTGRCVCRTGVSGNKCNSCTNDGEMLGPNGCAAADNAQMPARSCDDLTCYFGGVCKERDARPTCVCPTDLCTREETSMVVCGSDGQTYGSECQLRLFACRYQKDIVTASLGPCLEPTLAPDTTQSPMRHTTMRRTTDGATTRDGATRDDGYLTTGAPPLTTAAATDEPEREGLIGSVCFSKYECRVPLADCHQGRCRCPKHYAPSSNKDVCIAASAGIAKGDSVCGGDSCHRGATCMNVNAEHFKCICPIGRGGATCDEDHSYNIPAFSGTSWMRFKHMMAHSQVTIEIEFKPLYEDGIIIYNGQSVDGKGDFISLAIRSGYLEYRFDLGDGAVVIKSENRIELRRFYFVTLSRFNQDGRMKIEGVEEVSGRSEGKLKSLDVKRPMFLGNVPQATPGVMENMGVSLGLVGCIQSLKINSKEYDLVYPGSLDIEDGAEIGECGNNPCASLPCQNGGTCVKLEDEKFKCMCQQSHTGETCEEDVDPCSSSPCYMGATCNSMDEGSFSCKCPQGRTGEFCEDLIPEKHQTSIPEFNGRAYIEQPKLEVTSDTSLTVEIWFMAYSPNGMLLYNGQLPMGKGDFISINLVEGYVNYRYNLGSGTANITSRSPLTLNQWHQVVVTRYNRLGTLRVNDEELVDGESDPPSNELNLNQPLYIGGFSDRSQLSYMSGVVTGLKGAIQRVTVNGIIMGDLLESATDHYAVTRYFGPPCGGADENPCRNGGTCIPNLNDFMCKCSPDYMGKTCDKTAANGEMDKPVMFDGNLFLYYPNLVTRDVKGQIQNDYKLKLRTTADSGLILWQNMGNTVRGDYFAILLVDGYLQLNYNLGKQNPADLFIIRSTVRINDGEWHMIRVARNKRYGALTVDSHEAVTATSPTGATQLDTNGILWIGGAPNIPTELPEPYKQGFTGCIEEVFVGEQQLHLVHDGQNDVQTFCQDER